MPTSQHDVPAAVGRVAVEDEAAFFGGGEPACSHLEAGVDVADEGTGLETGLD